MRKIPQGFILALVLFTVSINDMEKTTEHTLKKSADDPKLGGRRGQSKQLQAELPFRAT